MGFKDPLRKLSFLLKELEGLGYDLPPVDDPQMESHLPKDILGLVREIRRLLFEAISSLDEALRLARKLPVLLNRADLPGLGDMLRGKRQPAVFSPVGDGPVGISEIDVSIWTSTDDRRRFQEAADAARKLLEEAGFEITTSGPARWGSWFQKFKARARDTLSNEEVAKRLADIEDAVRAQQLDLPQSQATLALAQAASAAIESLRGTPEAVLVLGNLLLVKITEAGIDRIVTYSMTAEELRQFKRGKLPQNPVAALDWLDKRSVDVGGSPELGAPPEAY